MFGIFQVIEIKFSQPNFRNKELDKKTQQQERQKIDEPHYLYLIKNNQ
ncbi:MAG: hypothetical protein LBL62_02155 [Planctomycetaceae bacterium]|jgi:hypothetical protein|nr:hypothetical protein [Planctomycetaceae bacterium]